MPRLSLLVASICVLASLSACQLPGRRPSGGTERWPQVHSDLHADPSVRFGTLPNGMRYAIQHNRTPPGQVSLRLRIGSGSLEESDAQQGLAHFLEHMAFRGSASVADGEVWKSLERLGLKMGADTNAFTAQTQTVYKFDLARNDDESIDTGLRMLRETCDALTLDGGAFDGERGVVLSELRLGDNPSRHATDALSHFLMPGQRASVRQPIGLATVLEAAPASEVRDFYGTWYRPERSVIVVTGDVDVSAMERRLRERFSSWSPALPARAEPDLGVPARRGMEGRLFVEPGAPSVTVISWVAPFDATADSIQREVRDTNRFIGMAILNRRLEAAADSPDHRFTFAKIGTRHQARSASIVSLVVQHEAGAWQPALAAAEALRRQVVAGGVRGAEVAREVASLRAQYDAALAGAATRQTANLADGIVASVDVGDVYTSPLQDRRLNQRILNHVTPASVNAAFRAMFPAGGPLAFVSSPTAGVGEDADVRAALEAAERAPVVAASAEEVALWPYGQFGPTGVIVDRATVADLDVHQVRFANGVRLNIKETHFAAGQVLVSVNVGSGRRAMDPDLPNASWASGAIVPGGTARLDYPSLQRTLAGQSCHIGFQIGDGAFSYSGQTTRVDLRRELELLAAYVTDPGWRAEAFEQQRSALIAQAAQVEAAPMALFQARLPGLLRSGDRRWAYPDATLIANTPADGLRTLMASALAQGPIEVTVVGDVTPARAEALVAATFGALPVRAGPSAATAVARFPDATASPVIVEHRGGRDQGVAAVAWPTTDAFSEREMAAGRLLLADVIQQRLFEEMRVKAGSSYAVQAASQTSMTFPGYGVLVAFADVPPERAVLFFDAVDRIARDLKDHGPTADEFARARNPELNRITQLRQTNPYWLSFLAASQTDARFLDIVRTQVDDLERATVADVQRAAQRYLDTGRRWQAIVRPAEN